MSSLLLYAYPKVNISLKVTGFDEKAKLHKIDSRMHLVTDGIFDTLSFSKDTSFSLSGFNFDMESNLIYKAYKLLKDSYDIPPYKIAVKKCIPFGAGLGGGSINAALTLLALNYLEALKLPYETLLAHARTLGMDVCFFICIYTQAGKFELVDFKQKDLFLSANAYNFGDILSPFHEPSFKIKLHTNHISCNTASVYKEFNHSFKNSSHDKKDYESLDLDSKTNLSPYILKSFSNLNDLEAPALKLYPELKEIKASLIKEYKEVYFSGSGASFFSLERAK
ncbi:hypothetical protein [Helicobacter sp. 11S02629-2]|uniref:GHMP family kinase ATP-binding protein n=1 Tax=Helicobacter sp. 11S02629-2 TaxID=1476195 RepID=UPI000BA5F701|nr:hypothetical protein [Helicobacter sp. 11S02629-2]PAF45433.1 hypothetical protein BKH40_02910 [Helicobacter sp. 11S02629-2]